MVNGWLVADDASEMESSRHTLGVVLAFARTTVAKRLRAPYWQGYRRPSFAA